MLGQALQLCGFQRTDSSLQTAFAEAVKTSQTKQALLGLGAKLGYVTEANIQSYLRAEIKYEPTIQAPRRLVQESLSAVARGGGRTQPLFGHIPPVSTQAAGGSPFAVYLFTQPVAQPHLNPRTNDHKKFWRITMRLVTTEQKEPLSIQGLQMFLDWCLISVGDINWIDPSTLDSPTSPRKIPQWGTLPEPIALRDTPLVCAWRHRRVRSSDR